MTGKATRGNVRRFNWDLLIDNLTWLGAASLAGVWGVVSKHDGIEERLKLGAAETNDALRTQAQTGRANERRIAAAENAIAAGVKSVATLENSTTQNAEALLAQRASQRKQVDDTNAALSELRRQLGSYETARREDLAAVRKDVDALKRIVEAAQREMKTLREDAIQAALQAIAKRLAEVEHEPGVAAVALSHAGG